MSSIEDHDLEQRLVARAKSLPAVAPELALESAVQRAATVSRRHVDSRRLLPAALACAVVAVIALAVAVVNGHHSAPTTSAARAPLSSSERSLAVQVARDQAAGAAPAGVPLPTAGWPSNVRSVAAGVVSRTEASSILGSISTADSQVLLVQVIGQFVVQTTGPAGSKPIAATEITVAVSMRTGQVTDSAVDSRPQHIPNSMLLYQR